MVLAPRLLLLLCAARTLAFKVDVVALESVEDVADTTKDRWNLLDDLSDKITTALSADGPLALSPGLTA